MALEIKKLLRSMCLRHGSFPPSAPAAARDWLLHSKARCPAGGRRPAGSPQLVACIQAEEARPSRAGAQP